MTRRGFTLLEVALAAAIGGLIVLAALGLLTAMDRTDRRLQARLEQQSELERVHLVMDRALGAILVSDQAPPSQQVSEGQERGAPLPPRIQLSMDRGMGQMARRPDASGEVNVTTPQRLEIVLLQSPVPTDEQSGAIDRWIRASRRIGDREREDEEEEESATPVAVAVPVPAETDGGVGAEAAVKAVRGAFEWRAKPVRDGFAGIERTEDGRTVWELWWVPLARLTDAGEPVEALVDPRPYRIASDIVYGRWLAFSKRERKPVYATAYRLELPAYFEMEIETVNGQYANWMFEVGWATGPETFRAPAPAEEGAASRDQPTREDLDRARARARVTPGGTRPAGTDGAGSGEGGK